jgi:hypothetical protein
MQSEKKDFVKEARERNKTIFRKRKENAPSSEHTGYVTDSSKSSSRKNLPKLKSLLPDTKRRDKPPNPPIKEQKPRLRQPKKYAHVRSSGYGGFGSTSILQEKLQERKAKPKKLPPIANGYR